MSDSYEVDGVKVVVVGGGYYELSHSALAEPERVRGKEAADARAAEIAKAAKGDSEGDMQSQGPLDPNLSPAQQAHVDQIEGNTGESVGITQKPGVAQQAPAPKVSQETQTDEQRRIAQLEASLKEANARNAELEKAGQPLAEALERDKPKPPAGAGIPRNFSGDMSADTRKMLKDMGQGTAKIILEENEDIPPTGLFLSHNGRAFVIQTGVEVEVPEFLLDILDHAVMSSPQVDSKTQKVLGYRNRLRYGYRRVG